LSKPNNIYDEEIRILAISYQGFNIAAEQARRDNRRNKTSASGKIP
jgi:hypothetical protein